MVRYEVYILGDLKPAYLAYLKKKLDDVLVIAEFKVETELLFIDNPSDIEENPEVKQVVLAYEASDEKHRRPITRALAQNIPIFPIVESIGDFDTKVPQELKQINCLFTNGEPTGLLSAVLEGLELVPAKRSIFLSYRRDETQGIAVQLFNELSAKNYSVFLDTHSIEPGRVFQDELWHILCNCETIIVLESEKYFESRWTVAEFGRAQTLGMLIQQIVMPNVNPRNTTALCTPKFLVDTDVIWGPKLSDAALAAIIGELEITRAKSSLVRFVNLKSNMIQALNASTFTILDGDRFESVKVADSQHNVSICYPVLGLPSSAEGLRCDLKAKGFPVRIVYDGTGIGVNHRRYLEWLNEKISPVKWIDSTNGAWDLYAN